ncbi:MAG: endopeptidase La [Deltaproteobacteria bacterium]|nr:MAG: endopeptidase La [Deltaproteobacteria bacterium]
MEEEKDKVMGVGEKVEAPKIPPELPLLLMEDMVIYPYTLVPLIIKDPKLISAVDYALSHGRIVGTFLLKDKERGEFYQVGSAVLIHRMLKFPDGSMRMLAQGATKVVIEKITQDDPFPKAQVRVVEEREEKDERVEALMRAVLGQYQKMISLVPYIPDELQAAAMNIEEPIRLVYFIATMVKMKPEEKQEILELDSAEDKLKKVSAILQREMELLELGTKIQSEVQDKMTKTQREYFLREQLKAIKKELGEEDELQVEIKEFREKMETANLPDYVMKEAERELSRLEKVPPASAEYGVIRTYLEWLIELPWNRETNDNMDLDRAKKILDEDHYDLKEVKERILEYLAVRKLREEMKGPILCFVGPPGVGKTSLGQSIAKALERKFVRISLGGMRDEAEIRGHRRTYIGALPGSIIQSIRRAGSKNPVFMLDEIDKVGADFRGDPSSALLEVLDPEQNVAFRDHYIDLPFDLSKVFFITTANVLETIHPALRDRMEILRLPGYTEEEKIAIAKEYLITKQMREHGLEAAEVNFTDEGIRKIISSYTKEAGVRSLEREIARICRKVAFKKAQGEGTGDTITPENLRDYLGPERYFSEVAMRTSRPGVVTGLAWTEAGGDILFIEAAKMPGKKGLSLTGHLGEVMQESAKAALSYVRTRAEELGIDKDFFEKYDLHVHVPAGAIPKDGPSAGIAIACALASVLSDRPVRDDVAMTGEITLSGLVLPVGGIKEKVLAAKAAGIKKVILPARNRGDVEEIGEELKGGVEFIFVESADEVFKLALTDSVGTSQGKDRISQ